MSVGKLWSTVMGEDEKKQNAEIKLEEEKDTFRIHMCIQRYLRVNNILRFLFFDKNNRKKSYLV